jgi:hypothetical protein
MDLKGVVNVCGTPNPPGTKAKLRLTVKGELAVWPKTRAEVKLAASPAQVPAQGDTKILDEAFSFAGAPSGKGYWREYDILIDKGNLTAVLEGELGGQGYKGTIPFTLVGMGAAQLEFADMLVAYSGCLIASISGRNGLDYVLGNLDIPVQVESAELGLGTKNGELSGGNYVLMAPTGFTPMLYNGATHGFDITPNP